MKKIKELTGMALMTVGFFALIIGCGYIESTIDVVGISLTVSGLIVIAIGATVAGAWYKPEYDETCVEQKQIISYKKAS